MSLSNPQKNVLQSINERSTGRGRRGLPVKESTGFNPRTVAALERRGLIEVSDVAAGPYGEMHAFVRTTPEGRQALAAV